MKKNYVSPRGIVANLRLNPHLLSNSDGDLDHLENDTDGDAGAKTYMGDFSEKLQIDNEEE